jgi:uncharacterized protein (UPF0297 family)
MKKTYAIIVLIVGMIISQHPTFAQRNCTSSEAHQHLMDSNVAYRQKRSSIEDHNKHYIHDEGLRTAVTIPVVVHVVWRTGFASENISDAQVLSQIDVLNKDFRRLNADAANTPSEFLPMAADCEINFCLAKRTPQGTATTGINRIQSSRTTTWGSNDDVKNPIAGGVSPWDPNKYLNIWVCNIGGGVLGYALFPGAPSFLDGVVIESKAFGTTGTAAFPFNSGRTVTHEVGHWLDLYHIWGDSTCGEDYVADTPLHSSSNTGCPTYPQMNNCSNKAEMTSNFMDYSNDACMNIFTVGQKNRMQALFSAGGDRANLLTSNGCVPVAQTATCSAPSGLNTANIGTNSATLTWAAAAGATAYTFSYRKSGVSTWNEIATSGTSYTLQNLINTTSYEVKVSTVCGTALSTTFASTIFTTLAPPSCVAPSAVVFSNTTNNVTTVSWAAASGVSSYTYKYKPTTASTWATGTTSTTNITLTSLVASTTYNFEISSVCTGATGTIVAQSFTTLAAPCTPPTAVIVGTPTTNGVQISWTAAFGITTYTYKYKPMATTTWTTISTVTGTSVTLSGLSPAIAYDFEVASNCPTITSTAIAKTFTTAALACTAPSAIVFSNTNSNSTIVSWIGANGVSSYNYKYKPTTTTTWTIGTTTTNNATLSNLSASTAYNFEVVSNCSGAISTAIAQNFTTSTVTNTCGAPVSLSASGITLNSTNITWSALSGAGSYTVYYKTAAATVFSQNSSATNSIVLTGLLANTSYNVKIESNCNGIISPASTLLSFKTSVNVCSTSPTGVTISAITGSKARISWASKTGVLSYKLQYKKTGTSTWTVVSSIFSPFYDITALTPATGYDVQVAAACASNITSAFTAIKVFKTTASAACSDVYESNENFLTAKVLNVGANITANIGKASDQDWFKISNSTTAKNIQLTLSNVTSSFNIKLYNSNNQLLTTGVSLGTNAKILRWNTLLTGNFYIQISTVNGASNPSDCYFLKVETSNINYGVAARKDASFVQPMAMNVFPNPAQDMTKVQIFSNEEKESNLSITDIAGKIIQQRKIVLQKEENLIDVELKNMNSGVYFIILSDAENQIVKRLIVQQD